MLYNLIFVLPIKLLYYFSSYNTQSQLTLVLCFNQSFAAKHLIICQTVGQLPNMSKPEPNPKLLYAQQNQRLAGQYKCNIDTSFSNQTNRVDIGICIQDDQGCFVFAKAESFIPICNVDVCETLDLLSGLRFAIGSRIALRSN